jgi:dipeptide/tripeptide permease
MMRPRSLTLRTALDLMHVRIVAMQIALAAVVFTLAVVWLRLPDSSALDVIATVLLGLLLLAIASCGELAIMLRLCGRSAPRAAMVRGAPLVLAGVALWFAWIAVVGHLQANDPLLAGYFNSRFPASLRNVFSYPHVYMSLEWTASALKWIGAGVLAVVVCSAAASTHPASAMRCALRSATYWISLLVGSLAAPFLTGLLMNWTPGHGLRIETVSLVLRLSTATILDAVIAVFVLAVLAVCMVQSDSTYATPAGGPDASQPRTTETP